MPTTRRSGPLARLLRLSVADLPSDDRECPTRTVWVNPAQIETVAEYVTWSELDAVLWLELTLASGTVLYSRSGPVPPAAIPAALVRAISALFPDDH